MAISSRVTLGNGMTLPAEKRALGAPPCLRGGRGIVWGGSSGGTERGAFTDKSCYRQSDRTTGTHRGRRVHHHTPPLPKFIHFTILYYIDNIASLAA